MDVLGYLKSRQNELERVDHPFINRSLPFRYLYSYGVGVIALGNMKAMTELSDQFDYFLECISLPKKQREKILVDLNNNFEFRLTECFKILKTKEVQYCFTIDLMKLSHLAVWSYDYCEKVLKNYLQIFHMSEPEIAFLNHFNDAVIQKDVELAKKNYCEFREMGFDISYHLLKYFFPEFEEEDQYQDIIVRSGKTVVFDKPTYIQGDIYVERGGSLIFDRATVNISGKIAVSGGRIQIRGTDIFVNQCRENFFLDIKDAAVVIIDNAIIDCNQCCGFIRQDSGRLLISESEFHHSNKKRMIEFSGIYAKINKCSFSEGKKGFIMAKESCQMQIQECDFFNGYAEYGGAIYSESIDNIVIQESSFRSCKTKYIGAAIYFKYQKLGQIVSNCIYRNCDTKENTVFNTYEDDFELKIR